MATDSVNVPEFVPALKQDVIAAANVGNNFPTAANTGNSGAVIAASAGSLAALQAGTAAAVGGLKFLEADTDEPVYIVTAK